MKFSLTLNDLSGAEVAKAVALFGGSTDDATESKPATTRKKTTRKKTTRKKTLKLDDVRKALSPLVKALGNDALRECLNAGEGADEKKPKLSDVDPESYPAVIAKAEEMMAEHEAEGDEGDEEEDPLG